jgi:hypothetical protein
MSNRIIESAHKDFIDNGGLDNIIAIVDDVSAHVRLYLVDIAISLIINCTVNQ